MLSLGAIGHASIPRQCQGQYQSGSIFSPRTSPHQGSIKPEGNLFYGMASLARGWADHPSPFELVKGVMSPTSPGIMMSEEGSNARGQGGTC